MERWLKAACFAVIVVVIPCVAAAHERQAFRIGDKAYTFVVGFANEPVFVDDKSGVDLRIRVADPKNPLDFSSSDARPAEKLETSLKVEVSAGDQKQVFALEPAFRDPGLYRATFFPTAAIPYSFRVFGELNGAPVSLTFTCSAAGHPGAEDDRSEVKLSDRVTRIFKAGSFGCPVARDAVQFPKKR
jgi:hypothetical protein